jgi:hypothetical protein
MAQKFYDVISPDGFPITCEPFKSKKEALNYIPGWCERFRQQGYYSTASRDHIALEDLPDYLEIIPASGCLSCH